MSRSSDYDSVKKTIWTPDPLEREVQELSHLIKLQNDKITALLKTLRENAKKVHMVPRNEVLRPVERDLNAILSEHAPGQNPRDAGNPGSLQDHVRSQLKFISDQQLELEKFLGILKEVVQQFVCQIGLPLFVVPVETCVAELKKETQEVTEERKRLEWVYEGKYC